MKVAHPGVIQLCDKLTAQPRWNVRSAHKPLRKLAVTLCLLDQRRTAGFGEARPQILDQRHMNGLLSALHERIAQRLVDGLPAADCKQMLLAAGAGDLDKILLRQTTGSSQDRLGDRSILMECKLAQRPSRSRTRLAKIDAERDQGWRVCLLNQPNEDVVEYSNLVFAEAVRVT